MRRRPCNAAHNSPFVLSRPRHRGGACFDIAPMLTAHVSLCPEHSSRRKVGYIYRLVLASCLELDLGPNQLGLLFASIVWDDLLCISV